MVEINNKILNFNSFLILLLPISFVVGPLIVEIIISILILQFLFFSFKEKNYSYLNNKIFFYFSIFYVFLLTSLLYSDYFSENYLNVIFYFRFIFFSFALYFFLIQDENLLKKIYIFFPIIFFVVVFDGLWQYFFEENLLGYPKYRPDRISGFFNEDLILGSYLSRLVPLYLGITLFFIKNKFLTVLNLFIILSTIILIFLTGERAAFFKLIIFLLIIILIIDFKIIIKLSLISVIAFIFSIFIFFNPSLLQRHYTQTINQLLNYDYTKNEFDKIKIFPRNYLPMFETSLKMFKDNKIIGQGPKSYRYACHKNEFKSFFPKPVYIDNTNISLSLDWKELRNFEIKEFFISEGDIIKKGDKIFEYNFIGSNELKTFFSDKEGEIKKILYKDRYVKSTKIIDIIPQSSPNIEVYNRSSCNTHPHNFYFQLLAETGLIGFLFILVLFLYITLILLKNFLYSFSQNHKKLTSIELCIISGFFVTLWPLTTNGNFFNNWLNLINFYPLGILIYIQNLKKEKSK
jgi:O-antigen ligase